MNRRFALLSLAMLTLASLVTPALAAATDPLAGARAYRAAHQKAIVDELVPFLAIPNVARDEANIGRNADAIVAMMERRGITAKKLVVEGAPPAVLGTLATPGAKRTVVFYAHYDGQPVVAKDWATPPWTPVLRAGTLDEGAKELPWSAIDGKADDDEWRIYGRSSSDDKSPIVAMMAAVDAIRASGMKPSVNLKFFFEGEEEAGSPHLGAILAKYRDDLSSDLWIFCDGPVHQSRRGEVVFGARGVVDLEMTVYGPTRALHSGHYGNWAPNPAALLVNLLASMRDDDGKILVPGIMERVRPLSDEEKRAIAAVPDIDTELRKELGLARTEANDASLAERIMIPALNIRGLRSGGVESEARNAIPTEAKASIDFRLVPDVTPELVRELVEKHVGKQGFHIVRSEPDMAIRLRYPRIVKMSWGDGYPALRTSMDLPVSQAVIRAVEEGRRETVVRLPNLGGSLPLYLFDSIFHVPLIAVPMVNHDNNQHAKNENLRLANLWQGVDMYAALMSRLDW